MADFSGAIKLVDVNDFLTPAQVCKVLEDDVKKAPEKEKKAKGSIIKIATEVDLRTEGQGKFKQMKLDKTKKKATISLADCLACSGCVTSAETILITAQSSSEFYSQLNNKEKITVVTISPHSRASLAHFYGLSEYEMLRKIVSWLKSIGVAYVFDSTFALDIALLEAQEEFVARYKAKKNLPLLASECPGWVCYAEKKHGDDIIPYMSTTKSPQQIMGTIVKNYLSEQLKQPPDKIFHATIMPCYDKKLEGSRPDFYDSTHNTRDVDVVLTTGELSEMLKEKEVDVSKLPLAPLDRYTSTDEEGTKLYRPTDTGGSGGYLENVLRFAAKKLFNIDAPKELKYKIGRNADYREIAIESEGKVVLNFLLCYGFSNIQNLATKIKNKKCPYHYIELMACPGGCLAGGGQIKAIGGIKAQKELVQKLDVSYHEKEVRQPSDNRLVQNLYKEWIKDSPYSESSKKLFHTQFHAVAKQTGDVLTPSVLAW